MDITGWTLEQRIRLPEWCFGSHQIMSVYLSNVAPGTSIWGQSLEILPADICIWAAGLLIVVNDAVWSFVRMGFRDTAPVNVGQMDASHNFLPGFGNTAFAPPRINTSLVTGLQYHVPLKMGVTPAGERLVAECYCSAGGTQTIVMLYIIYSTLPVDMAGWLSHNIV